MPESIQESSFSVNEIELYVALAGDRSNPAVLLIHGLYDRWEVWRPVIDRLTDRYFVIAPDLRGHARSSKPERGYTLNDYSSDLAGLARTLELPRVVPMGHSLGALITGYLSAQNPELVSSAVLVDPPFEQNSQTREWIQILLDAKRGTPQETYEMVKELNILSGDEGEWRRQAEWLQATADGPFEAMIEADSPDVHYEVLDRVTCPVLLLQADPFSGGALSDAGAQRALAHLPSAEHQKFHHTGHAIHLERPVELVQSVNEFLNPSE